MKELIFAEEKLPSPLMGITNMPVRRNSDGVIINASELIVDEVVGDRVLCPACHDKVFQV